MRYEWGRAPESSKWQRGAPVWFISVVVIAFAAGIAVWLFRERFVWTRLQQFYRSVYVRSAVASSLGIRTGRYRVLLMEHRRGSRLAIDDEVVPIALSTGETTLALSVLAREAGSGRSRPLGATRVVARWPSGLHEITVLSGVKGALRRRLLRP